MKKRILGLDTGTNSLGWAVVDKNTDGSYSLVKKGSLIFQEGVKIEKGIEKSKAAERTEYRASRKHYFRRRLRKIEVLKVLVDERLCPYISDEQLNLWHTKKQYPKNDDFMLWQRTTVEDNPYAYRYNCLFEQLDLNTERDRYVLGRALYHLAQRRGFLSNRLDSNEEESGAVKTAISDLDNDIKDAGCEFLGEYFYKLYKEQGIKVRLRNRYTDREEHYKKEFYAICEKQNLSEDLIKRLERALYFQRPLKSQRLGVGKCTFEPKKQRCATSHYAYEEFRMLTLLNNVKIKTPKDEEFRYLTTEEIAKAEVKFYRKTVKNFDFSEIAEAIAGKKNYACSDQIEEKPYRFNYRSTQGVSNCPTIAQLRDIFGADYQRGIAEVYRLNTRKDGSLKTIDEMCDDIWNVLYFFSSKDKLKEFAINNLQLDDEKAEAFSKIKLDRNFASLSLKAIRKILPFLRSGYIYSHAVFLANIPTILGKKTWEENKDFLEGNISSLIETYNPKDRHTQGSLEDCIKDFLEDNFRVEYKDLDKLYHPSMIEAYPDAQLVNGIYQLGSPRTDAIRNPMAMRALHQVRGLVNALLKDKTIDKNTEVHVEYARELNDSNKRQAISKWNKDREKERAQYRSEICEHFKSKGKEITPTDTDILKYQLWKEQDFKCLYTGKMIGITEFIGANPKYDIEHTVPQSVGGDSTQMNLTLCDSRFNREVKQAQLPSQLANHKDILDRIKSWEDRINKLSFQIDRIRTSPSMAKSQKDSLIQRKRLLQIERDYWRGKYEKFTMTEVPEGFALRQGMGIGLISKYAGLFLKSLFHNTEHNSNVRVVKGATTAEFRKMWGIQDLYEKKSRDNHVHHCIDAITIACIGVDEYSKMARFYHDQEAYKRGYGKRPVFDKPWSTFTEDIKQIEQDILVVHKTQDNMPKQAKKRVLTSRGKFLSMGDSARGALHRDSFYGAIEKDGAIKYVKRQSLVSFTKESDLDKIVDETVRNIIKDAVAGKDFKTAIQEPIYMNKEKGILIKKVRCYEPTVTEPLQIRQQRDLSRKEYKQKFNVLNDENYTMAIYEGEVKGKIKRSTELITMLDAAAYYKRSSDMKSLYKIAPVEKNGMKLRACVKKGTQVILLESPNEDVSCLTNKDLSNRLYYIAMMRKGGRILFRHSQTAKSATEIKQETKSGGFKKNIYACPQYMLSPSDFNFLIEGVDFSINILGEIDIYS